MEMYVCTKCKESKPENDFGRFKTKRDDQTHRRTVCKPCRSKQSADGMKKWREKQTITMTKHQGSIWESCRTYKLDFEPVWEHFQTTNNQCEICGMTPPNGRRLVLDHNHATGEFRGFLCSHCNTAIGLLRDCPSAMAKAIDYVRRDL